MSITVMVCYESEPTGGTKLNAKWLVMKPFGFFVESHLGLCLYIKLSIYIGSRIVSPSRLKALV